MIPIDWEITSIDLLFELLLNDISINIKESKLFCFAQYSIDRGTAFWAFAF